MRDNRIAADSFAFTLSAENIVAVRKAYDSVVSATILLCVISVCGSAYAQDLPPTWEWDRSKVGVYYSLSHVPEGFSVIASIVGGGQDVGLIFGKGTIQQVTLILNEEQSFLFSDDCLLVSLFSPTTTGCRLVSYDLQSGVKKLETALTGLGPISHSKYRNEVMLVASGTHIVVYGKESSGRYIEVLDPKSGSVLSRTVVQ